MARVKEENNLLGKAQQQIQELQQQLQELTSQNKQMSQKIEQLNEAKIQIEQQRLQTESEINWYKAKTERDFKQNTAENDNKRTEIEYLQQFDGNPYNDTIKKMR